MPYNARFLYQQPKIGINNYLIVNWFSLPLQTVEKHLVSHQETNEMVVTFDKEYLKELYEFGKANDKKHRFQLDIVRRYKRCIDIMIGVPDITLLCKYNGLSFEKLSGDKKDFCSVSVNNQYRIEFTIAEVQGEVVTTICNIIELSNHYK